MTRRGHVHWLAALRVQVMSGWLRAPKMPPSASVHTLPYGCQRPNRPANDHRDQGACFEPCHRPRSMGGSAEASTAHCCTPLSPGSAQARKVMAASGTVSVRGCARYVADKVQLNKAQPDSQAAHVATVASMAQHTGVHWLGATPWKRSVHAYGIWLAATAPYTAAFTAPPQ